MDTEPLAGVDEPLVGAREIAARQIAKRETLYRMARLGLVPSYRVGAKGGGVRFRVSEVLAALRVRETVGA